MLSILKFIDLVFIIAFIYMMIKGDQRDVFINEFKYSPLKCIVIAIIMIGILLI